MKRISIIGLTVLLLASVLFFFFPLQHEVKITGIAQGTEFVVVTMVPVWHSKVDVTSCVMGVFDRIDRQVSLYQPDSEICKFNNAAANNPILISDDFIKLMVFGRQLHQLSNGRWDGTVTTSNYPIGFHQIQLSNRHLIKKSPHLHLSLDSVAQGYTLDVIVDALQSMGAQSVVVEVGGEVRAYSKSNDAVSVKVALPNSQYSRFVGEVMIINEGIATSGRENGHVKIIDPITRQVVINDYESLTVVAPTGLIADGLSTTLWALPKSQWGAVISAFNGIRVYGIKMGDEKWVRIY